MNYLVGMVLGLVAAGVLGALIVYIRSRRAGQSNSSAEFLLLQQHLQQLSMRLDEKMGETHRVLGDTERHLHSALQQQFSASAKIISDVTERLTRLDETNKHVVGFAAQLDQFQQILSSPKQRGVLGEYYLENVLKNVLPPTTYQMQYAFANGEIVDAVVFVKDKIIPVDSKFSLENYNRLAGETDPVQREILEAQFVSDLKKRIDETSKYIRPEEGTLDFAFMFIPAEGIYYDLIVNTVGALKSNTQQLLEYAFCERRVIIVSPTSFLAYLQTVLQGLRGLQIEESAKEIRARVEDLGRHILAYDEYFKKLGNNLSTTVNSYNAAYKELNKIDKDVVRITDGERKIETLQLERPQLEE